jgi:hypothetical protein
VIGESGQAASCRALPLPLPLPLPPPLPPPLPLPPPRLQAATADRLRR